jgi:hypothetical protein
MEEKNNKPTQKGEYRPTEKEREAALTRLYLGTGAIAGFSVGGAIGLLTPYVWIVTAVGTAIGLGIGKYFNDRRRNAEK